MSGKPWHGHHRPGQNHHKARSRADIGLPHINLKALGTSQQPGIIGERILGLGHTYGKLSKPQLFHPVDLFLRLRGEYNSTGPVNFPGDGLDLFRKAQLIPVQQPEVALFVLQHIQHLKGKLLSALSSLFPHPGERERAAPLLTEVLYKGGLRLRVGDKAV